MYLELTDEQQFVSEAATDALSRQDSLASAREALDGADMTDLWPVAVEAGWPGLLSAEAADGAGLGAYEALLVLEACGARLADARLLGHLPAVALIEAGLAEDLALRTSLAAGERRAALVDAALAPAGATVKLGVDGTLTGRVSFVLDAPGADVLVVVADGRAFLVDAGAEEVTVESHTAYDATRRLGRVSLTGAPGRELDADVARGRDLQRALLGAESVGAAQACLTMARDYAVDRQAFGRAIGSYQSLKHRMTEMLRRVENGRSLMVEAGRGWPTPAFGLPANALRTVGADALDYAAPENIFIHGGIGATWEHDAQLYYRRAEVSRRLAGGAEAAAQAVADALLAAV
jgi:alkylation response protein AidB-like acyl-CoA dehydrogenase